MSTKTTIESILKEFDKLWPYDWTTERDLTIEEMEKLNTYYTKEVVTGKSFLTSSLIKVIESAILEIEGAKVENPEMIFYHEDEPIEKADLVKFGIFYKKQGTNVGLSTAKNLLEEYKKLI